jgi:hypothetical protein
MIHLLDSFAKDFNNQFLFVFVILIIGAITWLATGKGRTHEEDQKKEAGGMIFGCGIISIIFLILAVILYRSCNLNILQ